MRNKAGSDRSWVREHGLPVSFHTERAQTLPKAQPEADCRADVSTARSTENRPRLPQNDQQHQDEASTETAA